MPTSVEEIFVPEYCKKVRSKELKPRSNYRTRRKSPELAEETTPGHRANDVVVDDADFEGPRDEATLKGTACLKKVLGFVDDDDDCHSPRDVPADTGAEVEATTPLTDAYVPARENMTYIGKPPDRRSLLRLNTARTGQRNRHGPNMWNGDGIRRIPT